jgi:hypothetical protein
LLLLSPGSRSHVFVSLRAVQLGAFFGKLASGDLPIPMQWDPTAEPEFKSAKDRDLYYRARDLRAKGFQIEKRFSERDGSAAQQAASTAP